MDAQQVQQEIVIIAIEQLPEEQMQVIPVVCAWHEEYIEGSTSTICDDCMRKYFPKYS